MLTSYGNRGNLRPCNRNRQGSPGHMHICVQRGRFLHKPHKRPSFALLINHTWHTSTIFDGNKTFRCGGMSSACSPVRKLMLNGRESIAKPDLKVRRKHGPAQSGCCKRHMGRRARKTVCDTRNIVYGHRKAALECDQVVSSRKNSLDMQNRARCPKCEEPLS